MRASPLPVFLSAVLFLLPVLPRADEPAKGFDTPDPGWREGPVRYILIVKEDLAYKALKTDEERAGFIETFWAALDPTPGTPANEKRTEFWKRVEDANRMFREGMTPGWKSDRGKFYVLLGPPDDRQAPGPWEVWKYIALPNPDADPEVTFRFRRNGEGEYHVGTSKIEYWDPSQESAGPAVGDTFLAVRTPGGTRDMSRQRIRMAALQSVGTADFISAPMDHRLRLDYYKVKKNSTRVVVTLALTKEQFKVEGAGFQPPDMTLSVAVNDPKKNKPIGSYSEPMRLAGGASTLMDRPVVLQGSFTIEPGVYRAAFNIIDKVSHRGISRTETIEAPDFGRGLALSSIALGRLREEPGPAGAAAEAAKPGDASRPGDAGRAALIPEPESVFRPEDTILIAYEVYDAIHASGAKPDLEVTYAFSVDTGNGPRQVGKPVTLGHQASESLAYALPLRGWPEGSFRVRVRVTDNRNGATAEREESFRVGPAG